MYIYIYIHKQIYDDSSHDAHLEISIPGRLFGRMGCIPHHPNAFGLVLCQPTEVASDAFPSEAYRKKSNAHLANYRRNIHICIHICIYVKSITKDDRISIGSPQHLPDHMAAAGARSKSVV